MPVTEQGPKDDPLQVVQIGNGKLPPVVSASSDLAKQRIVDVVGHQGMALIIAAIAALAALNPVSQNACGGSAPSSTLNSEASLTATRESRCRTEIGRA